MDTFAQSADIEKDIKTSRRRWQKTDYRLKVRPKKKKGVKNMVSNDVTIFTKEEIQQKIEGLSVPGISVFFYLASSPAAGGPLGRGAAVVELNPNYPGKKQKKYILSTVNVEGMEPVGKGQKFSEADKAKKIAQWISERHHKL